MAESTGAIQAPGEIISVRRLEPQPEEASNTDPATAPTPISQSPGDPNPVEPEPADPKGSAPGVDEPSETPDEPKNASSQEPVAEPADEPTDGV